jgi:hypothetical protein
LCTWSPPPSTKTCTPFHHACSQQTALPDSTPDHAPPSMPCTASHGAHTTPLTQHSLSQLADVGSMNQLRLPSTGTQLPGGAQAARLRQPYHALARAGPARSGPQRRACATSVLHAVCAAFTKGVPIGHVCSLLCSVGSRRRRTPTTTSSKWMLLHEGQHGSP